MKSHSSRLYTPLSEGLKRTWASLKSRFEPSKGVKATQTVILPKDLTLDLKEVEENLHK